MLLRKKIFKVKLLKSYFQSCMLQQRFNGLTLIAIEYELWKKVDIKKLVDDFTSKYT